MPGQGSFYLKDVSGNIAALDSSGRIQVAGTSGSVNSDLSMFAVSGGYTSGGQNLAVQIVGASGSSVAQGTPVYLMAINQGGIGTGNVTLPAMAFEHGYNATANQWSRIQINVSGDGNRLRTTTEGRAPTYSINAQNVTLFSGTAVQVAPYIALMNFGSGTATPVYKIKSISISPDASSTIASGQAIKWDIVRFNAFSGGGTLISGIAMDTNDPSYSGTVAGPTLMKNCGSGATLDALYFSYVTTTEGPYVAKAGLTSDSVVEPMSNQLTNLLTMRMLDTKEIVIRSGYGFGVVQSSGQGYTQVTSGVFSFNIIYSVEA